MKVRTFTGTHAAAVDKQVSDWLATSNVQVRQTTTAFKPLRERGWDAISGRTTDPQGDGHRHFRLVRRPEGSVYRPTIPINTGYLDL
jgi:hypothetical protein